MSTKFEIELINKTRQQLQSEDIENLNGADAAVKVLSIASSLLGPMGVLISETVSSQIPNQQVDRISRYAIKLNGQLKDFKEEFLKARFSVPGVLDIWSEGARQAAKAFTEEKLAYIATFVTKSITDEELDVLQVMSIAALLEKVNHVEISILRYCSIPSSDLENRNKFEEEHPHLFLGETSWAPFAKVSDEMIKKRKQRGFIQGAYSNLDALGLLYLPRHRYSESRITVTIAGANLLKKLGFPAESYQSHHELREAENSRISVQEYAYR